MKEQAGRFEITQFGGHGGGHGNRLGWRQGTRRIIMHALSFA
jgi:hypothetical protein